MNHPSLRVWVVARAKVCVALSLLLVTSGVLEAQSGSGMAAMSKSGDNRGYTSGKYGLELNGIFRSWLSAVDGGSATSDVVTEKLGPDHIAHKHLSGVKYEDIAINASPADVGQLLQESLDNKKSSSRMDGKIISVDYDNKSGPEIDFFHALLTGFELPPLDATSKEACYVTLTLSPEFTRYVTKHGGTPMGGVVMRGEKKKCLVSNFAVQIDGLDEDARYVSRIQGIAMTQKGASTTVGESRDYNKEPGYWDVSNVTLTLPESHSQKFADWLDSFVIKGNNGRGAEKTMTVKLLTTDMKTTLLELQASGVGIFKLTPEKVEAGRETVRRMKAELYVDRWTVVSFAKP